MKHVQVYFGSNRYSTYYYRVTNKQWDKISRGDKIVVDSPKDGYTVATVTLKRDQKINTYNVNKWIVSVIDDTEYNNKNDVEYLSKRVDELETEVARLEKDKADRYLNTCMYW